MSLFDNRFRRRGFMKSKKDLAIEWLDALTSPTDKDDPNYCPRKHQIRNNILSKYSVLSLRRALLKKKLRWSGDKEEMLFRLLGDIIDPSVKDSEYYKVEKMKFVSEDDISSGIVRRVPEEERKTRSIFDRNIKAPDIIRRPTNIYADEKKREKPLLLDGINRRVLSCPLQCVAGPSLSYSNFSESDMNYSESDDISVYVASPRGVNGQWSRFECVTILLPSRRGWTSISDRVIADELAFSTSSLVLLPDIYNNQSFVAPVNQTMGQMHSSANATRRFSVFNRVASAVHFSRASLNARSIHLAGVEEGAAWAAHCAVDLTDLASLALAALTHANPRGHISQVSLNDFSGIQIGLARNCSFHWPYRGELMILNTSITQNISSAPFSLPPSLKNSLHESTFAQLPSSFSRSSFVGGIIERLRHLSVVISQREDFDKRWATFANQTKKTLKPNPPKFNLPERTHFRFLYRALHALSRRLLAFRTSLTLLDLVYLAPRSLSIIDPILSPRPQLDLDFLADNLQLPVNLRIAGMNPDGSLNQPKIERMYDKFKERIHDVEEICLRVYDPCVRGFVSHPIGLIDKHCRNNVLSSSAGWVNVFKERHSLMVAGVGRGKLVRDQAFVVVNEQMVDTSAPLLEHVKPSIHRNRDIMDPELNQ